VCSDSVSSMRGDCPICDSVGYLILEKPRKKKNSLTNWDVWQYFRNCYPNLPDYDLASRIFRETGLSSRNIPHQPYTSREERVRRPYYKFSHYDSNPCYIGCLTFAIKKLKKVLPVLEKLAEKKRDEPEMSDEEIEERKMNPYKPDMGKSAELRKKRDNTQKFIKQAIEHHNKNYKPDPNDSRNIYEVIKMARRFRIVFDKELNEHKLL